jgi:diguanylate cyclase (GGDEF)-like protein
MYSPKRNYLTLIQLLQKEAEKHDSFVTVLLDIDHFHQVRPDLTPDERLQLFYEMLTSAFVEAVHYLGRDEFAVLLPNRRLEDVFLELGAVKMRAESDLQITFSAGIADYPRQGNDLTEFLRILEESVFQSKVEGRNRITIATEPKMKLKSNYYTLTQLNRLSKLSEKLNRTEASLLRESLDELIRKYEG